MLIKPLYPHCPFWLPTFFLILIFATVQILIARRNPNYNQPRQTNAFQVDIERLPTRKKINFISCQCMKVDIQLVVV